MHVLGIDAGGTKTVCLLADEHGTVTAEARGPGANLHASGDLEVEKVLTRVMEAAIGDRDARPAAIIFFSYVGFDTASTTALEARNPQRDLPLGIIGALVISAVLYVAMATVLTGMVPFQKLDSDAPVAVALDAHPQLAWLSSFVKAGVIAGMTSVILTSLLGQPRILLSMADDGLLPPFMSRCHPRFKTPHVSTLVTGVFAALIAAVFPLDLLADLISMGILLAFAVVCLGVLVLRYTRPDAHRPFRVPWAPVTCVLGTVVCLGMTAFLSAATWKRLVIWTAIGMSIYAFYGFRHSRLRQ